MKKIYRVRIANDELQVEEYEVERETEKTYLIKDCPLQSRVLKRDLYYVSDWGCETWGFNLKECVLKIVVKIDSKINIYKKQLDNYEAIKREITEWI